MKYDKDAGTIVETEDKSKSCTLAYQELGYRCEEPWPIVKGETLYGRVPASVVRQIHPLLSGGSAKQKFASGDERMVQK